jgi:hypothetical protein
MAKKDEKDEKRVTAPAKGTDAAKDAEAETEADDEAPQPDETVPGGRYKVGDRIVNAHGETIK